MQWFEVDSNLHPWLQGTEHTPTPPHPIYRNGQLDMGTFRGVLRVQLPLPPICMGSTPRATNRCITIKKA